MTLYLHEMKRTRTSTLIWTLALAFMTVLVVVLYLPMKDQLADMNDMLADMGALSSAFGMDSLDMGNFTNYFALECGEILGLGGALFAAFSAVGMISKEEKGRSAEFLLTHPVSRNSVLVSKLSCLFTNVTFLNAVVLITFFAVSLLIGAEIETKSILLLFLSYYLLQLEFMFISFGVSAFARKASSAVAIGLVVGTYFMNLASNITDKAELLKYITPFAFASGSEIIKNGAIEIKYLAIALAFSVIGVVSAFIKYNKKDIN